MLFSMHNLPNHAPLLQGLKFLYIIYTKTLFHTQMKLTKTPTDLSKKGLDHVILSE